MWSLVKGGFYRIETTNESRGWHLHMHVLVDARWVDARLLAQEWGAIVGQDFAIVCVKDARRGGDYRGGDYLKELTKYVVKGDQLSSWTPTQISDFIDAFTGLRTFGVFGSLFSKRTEWKEFLTELRAGRVRCACGCSKFEILSENQWQWEETVNPVTAAIPPPMQQSHDTRQMELLTERSLPPI